MKAHQMVLRHLARPKEEQRTRQMVRNFDHQAEAPITPRPLVRQLVRPKEDLNPPSGQEIGSTVERTIITPRRIHQWREEDAAKACHPLAWLIETMQMIKGGFVARQ